MQHDYVLRSALNGETALKYAVSAAGELQIGVGPAEPIRVLRRENSGLLTLLIGERLVTGAVTRSGEQGEILQISLDGRLYNLRLRESAIDAMEQALVTSQAAGGTIQVRSPIPGLVKAVFVKTGDLVKAGQKLVVLEAMKMENEIVALHDGSVAALDVAPGQAVAAGASLLKIVT